MINKQMKSINWYPDNETDVMSLEKLESSTARVQALLKKRLFRSNHVPAVHGYEKELSQLRDLIWRSVSTGESNSLLLVGPRGCGKTMLLSTVLNELKQKKDFKDSLIEVQLNGLLQTDDRLSLKEITRQMELENVVGNRVFGSFAENLQFLLESLKSGDRRSKCVLFVLDEFDLFTYHKNQTLLYNLFDVAQSAQAPVCVIGLTARIDVTELLEKRVKSRFSHRQIQLFPSHSFDSYVEIFRSYLVLPSDFGGPKQYISDWNAKVQSLSLEPTIVEFLQRQFNLDSDIRALQSFMLLPICQVNADHPYLDASDFVESYKVLHATDSKAALLRGISVLELCLIIAIKHLNDIYHGEPFNFEMVFNEYQKFCQRKSSMQIFEKPVVLKAFEHLVALELLRPVSGCATKTQKEYQLMNLMVDQSEIMESLQKYPNCPTDIKQWASCSVVST